jgi:hypothetical protein
MNQVITPIASAVQVVVNLDTTRKALVKGIGKVGELINNYGMGLNQAFDLVDNEGNVTTKWYDLQGTLRKGVKVERDNFKADMEAAGYSKATTDVYWQRVKESCGYQTAGNKAKGDMDIDAKTLSELKTILNRIFNDDAESVSQTVKPLLMSAFEQLGGDIMKLGTNNKA